MKNILIPAAFLLAVNLTAQAQTTDPTTPVNTETTAQKANTGIPYADRMNYATMTYEQVPRDVRLSFGNAYPNAYNPTWESNKDGYRTTFQQEGRSMSIRYDLQGREQERRTGIRVEDLPLPVRNKLQGQEANLPYEIRVGNEIYYSAEVGGKEMYYDARGKSIKAPKIK